MARPKRCRRICTEPDFDAFTPAGIPCAETVTLTLEEYETGGEPMKARLLVLRYFDGLTEESVMDFINASRNTYYAWKKDVLDTVAFHAAQKGLL